MGAADPENPLFLGFSVLRGGLRPWSQTMVSEGAGPWGRGRSGDCHLARCCSTHHVMNARSHQLSGPVLSDTARLSQRYPPIARYGVLVSQHGQLGAIPLPPFLSVSPLESMRSGGAIPPLKRGISAILARYPMKTRQMGAIPPSAILSQKGIARYGGLSRIGPLSSSVKP